jgi:fibronectin-binding autotransporter adhesin
MLAKSRATPAAAFRTRLRLEALEDRLAPATHTWTGGAGAGNLNWSTPSNWQANSPPFPLESSPVILNFPAVAANLKATVDDITGISGTTLSVDQINFTDTGYSISGSPSGNTLNLNGGATVSDGVGGNTFAASLALVLSSGSMTTFQIGIGSPVTDTIASPISGSGTLNLSGVGTLVLSGTNTFTGAISVNSGRLQVASDANLGDPTAGLAVGGTLVTTASFTTGRTIQVGMPTGTFDVAPGTTLTATGPVIGSGTLIKVNGGTLVLSNTGNSYSGTAINGGTVSVANDTNLGISGSGVSFDGGTLATTASFSSTRAFTINAGGGTFDVAPGTSLLLSGSIGGAGRLTKANAGLLDLTNTATSHSGGTTIAAGTLVAAADTQLGAPTGDLTFAGGTLSTTASFTTARPIIFSASATFSVASATTLTLTGSVSGAGGLTTTNLGRLVLGGTSTYGGATTVNFGTLANGVVNGIPVTSTLFVTAPGTFDLNGFDQTLSAIASTGTITNSSSSPATLTVNNAASIGFPGQLTGNLNLAKSGAGILTLTAANSYTGATTVNAGVLTDGVANALPASTTLTVNALGAYDLGGFNQTVSGFQGAGVIADSGAAATLTDAVSGNQTFSGQLGGSLALTLNGFGTQTLAGAAPNGYTGVTTVFAGTLNLAKNAGVVAVPGNVVIGGVSSPGSQGALAVVVSSNEQIADTATVTINPPGQLSVTSPATAETIGALTMTGGSVDTSSATLTVNGTITATSDQFGSAATISGNLVLGSGGGTFVVNAGSGSHDLDVFAVVSGNAALVKNGSGRMVLDAANSYTGATVVNAGTLANGATNALPPSTALTVASGATYDLFTFNQQVAAISGTGTITSSASSSSGTVTLTVDGSQTTSYDGPLTGPLGLTKNNTSTLTLNGFNTYTGPTLVNGGTLLVNQTQLSSPVTVASGGTLGGNGTVGPLTVNAGGTVSPGTSPGTLGTTSATLAPGSTYTAELVGPSSSQFDQLSASGPANINGSNLNLVLDPSFASQTPVGSQFPIVRASSLSGTFAGLPDGTTFTRNAGSTPVAFRINYTPTAAVLSTVSTGPTNLQATLSPSTINEGDSLVLSASFSDPGSSQPHTVTISWGDGSQDTLTLAPTATSFAQSHRYLNNSPDGRAFLVSLTVADASGHSVSTTLFADVLNVAPVITALSATLDATGVTTLTGTFEDPGTLDTFTLTVVWGDGTAPESFALPAGPRQFTEQHRYQSVAPGTLIHVFLQDSDGGMNQAVTPAPVPPPPPPPPVVVHDFISALYRDVLLRGPDSGGFAFWTGVLNSGLMNREQIATQFLISHERHGIVVDEFYRQILHRQSDADGRQNWVNALDHGVSEADVVVQFVTSPEYQRSHQDNRSYAQGLYQDLLLRLRPGELTTQELDFQQRALDFQVVTRARMALSFLFSDEAYVKAIHYDFNTFLRREPTPDNLSFFFASITRGFLTATGLQARLLGSQEYFLMVTAP